MEVCTTEKQMERRTACLQVNVEFLHQALIKLDRETRDQIATANRNLSDAEVRSPRLSWRSKNWIGKSRKWKQRPSPAARSS